MSPYDDVESLLAKLTLEEKITLLTGRDFWRTAAIPTIGLRSMLFSDGPSGVRGERWDEREPSLNLPSATALASSWDPVLAYRYGAVIAAEARRKGVDVVLGPTINLHRSPYGGRHFEAFSEDPVLTAELAAKYVSGVQDNGIAATPKHYVANDFETERFTVDVRVEERALRELYLQAFEKPIVDSHAWAVMSAYNSINGARATENELLEIPLNSEWGFDGVVVSDWTAVRSVESARYSQDLVMPGPDGPWGDQLVSAVRSGAIEESMIDRKVVRLLTLASRVGALEDPRPAPATRTSVEDGAAFAREAAAAGTVLLSNNGELPWTANSLSTLAVIGHNAQEARSQGGGSATVLPEHVVSPLEGLRAALPNVDISYSMGAVVKESVTELPRDRIVNPATGDAGLLVRFLGPDGTELRRENRRSTALVWFGGDVPIAEATTLELTTAYRPEATGRIRLGFATTGHARILVDEKVVLDETLLADGDDLGAALLSPPSAVAEVAVTKDVPIAITALVDVSDRLGILANAMAFAFGMGPTLSDPDELIRAAASAAGQADAAVVVVGTDARVESEGYDRTSLALPGRQDDLVRAVVRANPRTIVVVNAGAPVLMPWRDEVAAVLVGYFGGQEFGHALADVLLGMREPGGRLPTTWPATETEIPIGEVHPTDGVVRYGEGIHIGYRAWLKTRLEPAYPFGHGLGYTTWKIGGMRVVLYGDRAEVLVDLENTGARTGKQVIQIYAERPDSSVDRPVRWLVGFAAAHVEAHTSAVVLIDVPIRSLAFWQDGWRYESGVYHLHLGSSVTDLLGHVDIELSTKDGSSGELKQSPR